MTNFAPLEKALSIEGATAHVVASPGVIDIWWEDPNVEDSIADFKYPGSCAEATVILGEGGEWQRLLVAEGARDRGILTACLALTETMLRKYHMWPAYIAENANSSHIYQEAGFANDPQRPGLMIKDQTKAERWVKGHKKS